MDIFRKMLRFTIIKIYLLLFAVIFCNSAVGQHKTYDSLEFRLSKNLENDVPVSENMPILKQLFELTRISKPYLALEYGAMALNTAVEINDQEAKAEWFSKIADIYLEQKTYYMAMQNYFSAFEIYNGLGMKKETGYAQMSIGETYFIQGVEDVSLSYYRQAEEIFTKIDYPKGLAKVKNKIGLVNLEMYQYDKAMEMFNQSLELSEKLKDPLLTAETYCNIAEIYFQNEDFANESQFLTKAISKYRLGGDRLAMGKCYFKIGDMYFYQDEYDKAFINYLQSANIFKAFDLPLLHTQAQNRMARINFIQGLYPEAMQTAEKALKAATENELLQEKSDAYLLIAEIYSALNNNKEAYDNLMRYSKVKDTVIQEKREERFSELQVSIATKEKEKELALAAQEMKRKEVVFKVVLIMAILVLLLLVVIFLNNRKIKKVNNLLTAKNDEVKRQNQEIVKQKNIVDHANLEIKKQKNEIEEINNNITAGINYAARIQHATLPDISFVKQHFQEGFVFFQPKETVSGDFYWFAEIKDDKPPSLFRRKSDIDDKFKYVVAVIDCTGHGVPGAFMSMLGDAFLNQKVKQQKITSPDLILNGLHKFIRATLQQETSENNDGMDAAICTIDKHNKIMEFAGAKSPLIYIQRGQAEKINGDLKSIGGMQNEQERIFTKHTISIEETTRFYIYSDGFQDQFGGKAGRKFMAKPFRNMLIENSGKPFDEQRDILQEKLNEWKGDWVQMDDITVIGIKI